MKTDIWMPITIGDYLKDTQHLTAEEHGAYLLILMNMWVNNGWIPEKTISRIAGHVKDWDEVWSIIKPFFLFEKDKVSQKRLLEELEKSGERRRKAHENGLKGGRPKNPEVNLKVNPMVNHPGTQPGKLEKSSSSSSSSSSLKTIITPLPPKGDAHSTCLTFEQFWDKYNKKADRLRTEKAFKKLTEPEKVLIRQTLPAYLLSTPDAQYRKNPSTYLNGKCWLDQPTTAKPQREVFNG